MQIFLRFYAFFCVLSSLVVIFDTLSIFLRQSLKSQINKLSSKILLTRAYYRMYENHTPVGLSSNVHRTPVHTIYTLYISRDFGIDNVYIFFLQICIYHKNVVPLHRETVGLHSMSIDLSRSRGCQERPLSATAPQQGTLLVLSYQRMDRPLPHTRY